MIRLNKIILFIVLGFLFSCIEEYYPESGETNEKIVIDGKLTNLTGIQSVRISRTVSITESSFRPVVGCIVEVTDNHGNSFEYFEARDGVYRREFKESEVEIGDSYALRVITPEGEEYVSDYVMMTESSPVDSVYYREESLVSFGEDFNYEGIQFYIDINASVNDSRYYGYQLVEAWETYTPYTIEYVYDSGKVMTAPDELAGLNHCWMNSNVEKFYVASTHDQIENKLSGVPLHYVNSSTARLKHKYGLKVMQLSISEEAYKYYNALNKHLY